ncbi:MAG: rod shape-determining protein MreC [Bacteroidota bacterium]
MRNLLMLFVRNGGLVLFLLLEALCMVLVVQFSKKHNEILFSSASNISGYFYKQFDEVAKFYSLSSVADTLARENARIYNQLDQSKLVRSPWQDTMGRQPEQLPWYTYLPAQVRSNSINAHSNTILIDIGKKHGVSSGMGVVSSNGIVGIVRNARENFSSVMSVLHKESRISVKLLKNGYFGFLIWDGSNPLKASLIDVPKHAGFQPGDTIVTSGYSTLFPEGIMVGTVEESRIEPGSNSWDIDIKLSNDLANIKYVYVIDNLLKEEIQELEEGNADE